MAFLKKAGVSYLGAGSGRDMNTKSSEGNDFGTSTSVSGDWLGVEYDALPIDAELAIAVLTIFVVDDARLHEKLGEHEARQFMDRCVKRVLHAAESFDGRAVEVACGEVFADFAGADDALKAALEMLRRVADLPPVSGVKLDLRIGFSYGPNSENVDSLSSSVASTAKSLALMAKAGQIAACIRAQSALSPPISARYDAHCRDWLLAQKPDNEPIPGPGQSSVSVEAVAGDRKARQKGLLLKFSGKIYVLDEAHPEIRIGRDEENDLVLQGKHASRFHATIKRRGQDIVLIDTSTNGTFVSFKDDAPHILLIQRECVLQGCGVLSFSTADPATGIGTSSARFEIL